MLLLIGSLYLWWKQPRSAQQLFEVRCSSCHELMRATICSYPAQLRVQIVEVMRHSHGADSVIDAQESSLIQHYLREGLKCP